MISLQRELYRTIASQRGERRPRLAGRKLLELDRDITALAGKLPPPVPHDLLAGECDGTCDACAAALVKLRDRVYRSAHSTAAGVAATISLLQEQSSVELAHERLMFATMDA